MMEWFKKALRGEEKLWKVFWLYGVLGYLMVTLSSMLMMPIFMYRQTIDESILAPIIYAIVGGAPFVLLTVYVVYMSVALWRCAFNVRIKFLGYIARAIALCLVLLYIAYFGIGILLGLRGGA